MNDTIGTAYTDARGRIFFDPKSPPMADGGIPCPPSREDLLPAPPGTVTTMLPGRRPLRSSGKSMKRRTALAALLPSGYTRLLLPAYESDQGAPVLPLFGYTFACVIDDALHVAAMRTDASQDWTPRYFAPGELDALIAARRAHDLHNRVLAQLETCSRSYGCFTAQNNFLMRGEAALPVSPKCNARCIGCISEQEEEVGFPSPQTRVSAEAQTDELVRIALFHLERVPDGIISFGQGCEGEPLLRANVIADAVARIRARTSAGTINLNTNGSMPKMLQRLVDAGLDAVRVSLNAFRPRTYAAYYRPIGYDLDDVFESVASAANAGLRVSLNLLTHPGVTDDCEELEAMTAFLARVPVGMVQTRTLNIDPERYFAAVGRPRDPLGMRHALERIQALGPRVGNFTHAH